jgi:flavin-dependent dehydrogenase
MASRPYDAIVVGARCAGSPTAMLLARRGYRVLLVDRAKFPSDVVAGHYIHHAGIAKLARWGLLGRVVASNCPAIVKLTMDLGEVRLTVDHSTGMVDFGTFTRRFGPPAPVGAETYSPRRSVLDQILVEAAIEAGAELREGVRVERVVLSEGRARGISYRARGGHLVTETARIVIGADGRGSLVARSVGADVHHQRPMLTCGWRSYWSGIDVDGLEYYPRDGNAVLAMPTNDGLVWISAGALRKDFSTLRRHPERTYLDIIQLAPSLAQRLRNAKRQEPIVSTGSMPNRLRRPYGAGWALVGDAGYAHDPTSGQGISDAFRDAELLAQAVDDGFSDRRPLVEALGDYERRRNEAVGLTYPVALELGRLEPVSATMLKMFNVLGDQARAITERAAQPAQE